MSNSNTYDDITDLRRCHDIDFLLELLKVTIAKIISNFKICHTKLLYRGQSNCNWKLESTLWRVSQEKIQRRKYDLLLEDAFNIFKDQTHCPPITEAIDHPEIVIDCAPKNYEKMAKFRHLGYPTPFLDWSRSFYTALYFAYKEFLTNDPSLFVYIESPEKMKYTSSRDINISLISRKYVRQNIRYEQGIKHLDTKTENVTPHQRHANQKSNYMIAWCEDEQGEVFYSSPCQCFFNKKENDSLQNFLHKFILPKTLREKMLLLLKNRKIDEQTIMHGASNGEQEAIKKIIKKQYPQKNNQ